MITKIYGILNVTPDSFSDGGHYVDVAAALTHAEKLISDGADIIDIGADSTRPSSICVGEDEEWRRLQPVVDALAGKIPLSIDTHHAAVAQRALHAGARGINDISAGADPDMFRVVKELGGELVLMYSRCPTPHNYVQAQGVFSFDEILEFFEERIECALQAGIVREKLILDPGMGAFIGAPRNSWQVLSQLSRLDSFGLPILLGVSRKGFLKSQEDDTPQSRDAASAAVSLLSSLSCRSPVYVRTHNATMTRRFLSQLT